MIVPFDFLLPFYKRGDFRPVHKLIRSADHATVMTLQVSSEELMQRNEARLREVRVWFFTRPRLSWIRRYKRLKLNRRLYGDPGRMESLYREWASTVADIPGTKNVLLKNREDFTYEIMGGDRSP